MNKNETQKEIQRIKQLLGDDRIDEVFKKISFLVEKTTLDRETLGDLYVIKNEYKSISKDILHFGRTNELSVFRQKNIRKIISLIQDVEDQIETAEKNTESKKPEREKLIKTEDWAGQEVIVAKNLKQNYKKFSLQVDKVAFRFNEITSVVGRNGSGKSTLLKIIAGELISDKGTISFSHLNHPDNWYEIKKQMAFIPQRILEKHYSLLDTLRINATLRGIPKNELELRVQDVITKLELDSIIEKKWNELSGGFQMRFELAKCLIWRPKILILDEPLANLDIVAQKKFLDDVRNYANSVKHPMTVLITSQHIDEVEAISDNIIFLKEGELLFNDARKNLGKNRISNSFELKTNDSKVEELFIELGSDFSIRKETTHYLIEAPKSVSSNQLLKLLLEKEIYVDSFKNITFSTKILFDIYE